MLRHSTKLRATVEGCIEHSAYGRDDTSRFVGSSFRGYGEIAFDSEGLMVGFERVSATKRHRL